MDVGVPMTEVYDPDKFHIENPYPCPVDYLSMKLMAPSEIRLLKSYWATHLPMSGHILDLCSSGQSHFPECYQPQACRRELYITLCGPHQSLMAKTRWRVEDSICVDFNSTAHGVRFLESMLLQQYPLFQGFDAITNVLNAHCLRYPVEVFGGLWHMTKPGGCIYLVVGKWCPLDESLAIKIAKDNTGMARETMLCDFLHLAG